MSFENQNVVQPNNLNSFGNNSGCGESAIVPPEVAAKFNWGAFLLNWIWGIGNKSYIALVALAVAFIPFVGGIASLGFSIWLGIKGNELAWKNKEFQSIEAFHEYQKKWAMWSVIVIVASIILSVIGIVLVGIGSAMSGGY